jgi:hypothetical protein
MTHTHTRTHIHARAHTGDIKHKEQHFQTLRKRVLVILFV